MCDKCEACYHGNCITRSEWIEPARGPWYCNPCRGKIVLYGYMDITEDIGLLDYLFRNVLP